MAATEIADRFPPNHFDAAATSLAFSEMSKQEQVYVLAAVGRVLRPGGRLVVADAVRPTGFFARLRYTCVRLPVALITYLLTQTTTVAVQHLAERVRKAGFHILDEQKLPGGVGLIVAERSAEPLRENQ